MKTLKELRISPWPWSIVDFCAGHIGVASVNGRRVFDSTLLEDARLIAAAPELYEACLAALDYIVEFPDSVAQDIREALEGAIEKASGQEVYK